MAVVFFTGFPGFLGAALLPRVLARRPDDSAVCLVQAKYSQLAADRLAELEADEPSLAGRVTLVEGDITEADLGFAEPEALADDVSEIYHLAAVYDLELPRDLGMRVNVAGTRHVLDFAERCPGLVRFHHVSTCYVSGRHVGIFSEDDLDEGQAFNNAYEETKFLSEVDVQARIARGLPATVYRPAITVGDSTTGETQKYDGPYAVILLLLRQGDRALMPVVGDPDRSRLNVVPRDFVIDGIDELSAQPWSAGRVYQLADPEAPTIREFIDALAEATGQRVAKVPMPLTVGKEALARLPGAQALTGLSPAAVDYFVHPTFYATQRTQEALAATGIRAPRFVSYADAIVDYVRRHPKVTTDAMA
jgi:thioester reductase-like protein